MIGDVYIPNSRSQRNQEEKCLKEPQTHSFHDPASPQVKLVAINRTQTYTHRERHTHTCILCKCKLNGCWLGEWERSGGNPVCVCVRACVCVVSMICTKKKRQERVPLGQ